MTNEPLKSKTFVINYNLKSAIEEYNQRKPKISFPSFNIKRGRPQNETWRNQPKLQIIISLLGPSNAGKSSLAVNIEYGQSLSNFRSPVTVGLDTSFFHLDSLFEDKYVIIIQLLDCPGNDKYEAVSDRHFRNCHGAILMIDSTNIESFQRLKNYWHKRLREKSLFDNIETVLACNKLDLLENHDTNYRQRFFSQIDRFSSQYQIPVYNISALRGDNVQIMFSQLILNILKNRSLMKMIKPQHPLKIELKKSCEC